ncbi:hypothetical protein ACROYT_G029505, partial [Oculina patagonica]
FLRDVSLTVSIQSLVWIALDRFVAVVLPVKAHLISSRFRAFAIASTWVVAMVGNCSVLYITDLILQQEEIVCSYIQSTAFFLTFSRVRTIFLQIVPLVAITILYCAIAMALRRQDKALQCRAVHQKDQRKRQAIKMSFCVMVGFYICFLPGLFGTLMLQYKVTASCSLLKVLWFIGTSLLCFSSAINPIICMTFVQSFRREFIEIASSCSSKRLATYNTNNKEKFEQEKITLRDIRITAALEDNPTFIKSEKRQSETRF